MNPTAMTPAFALALQANFGSVEAWAAQWLGLDGEAGCCVLVFDAHSGGLHNQWLPEGQTLPPHSLLVMAGSQRPASAQALLAAVDWAPVYEAYQQAVHAASEPFGASADALAGSLLLDVRRAGPYAQASTQLPGARWCDPAAVSDWATELPRDQAVVVYCIYGHEVGRATALRLRAAGLDARFLTGGIDTWQAEGRPLAPKPPANAAPQ